MFSTSDISLVSELDFSPRDVAALYERVGFGTSADYLKDPRFLQRLTGPGCFLLFARNDVDNKLIGIIRVLSDDYLITWICEICVDPDYRRRGIGRLLMTWAQRRFGHTALYASAIRGTELFFERCGLRAKSKLIALSKAPAPDIGLIQ